MVCGERGDCCHSVPVTPKEAFAILRAMGKDEREVFTYFKGTNAGLFTETNPVIREDRPDLGEGPLVFSYCKFLTQDGRCSVYQDRPRICKEYPCEVCHLDNE